MRNDLTATEVADDNTLYREQRNFRVGTFVVEADKCRIP